MSQYLILSWLDVRLIEDGIVCPMADSMQVECTLPAHQMADGVWYSTVLIALEFGFVVPIDGQPYTLKRSGF